MSYIWPFDVKNITTFAENIRPFKCLLLMPFENRFNTIADVIKDTVDNVIKSMHMEPPVIKRLDWVTSSNVIQNEIWQEIIEADIIFCDITGYNPNVMFECGVASAWKAMNQVIFIKDHYFKQQSAFDIAPIRYTEYELTSDGIISFKQKVASLTQNAIITFPKVISPQLILEMPYFKDFEDNQDDVRIVTPAFSHRRVCNGALEFGSIYSFAHSWASLGNYQYLTFSLEFSARCVNPLKDTSWIGVGLRSQHYFANFAHLLYLKRNGEIVLTEPNEKKPDFYTDKVLRPTTAINADEYHNFKVDFSKSNLKIRVDDALYTFALKDMKKVFGPGLIRFQSSTCWMALKQIKLSAVED